MGISGIVRARTWGDAYSICEDEFFPEANDTIDELRKEYNFTHESRKVIRAVGFLPDPNDPASKYLNIDEKFDELSDYTDGGKLPEGKFLRWETIIEPCEDENGWTENALFNEAYGFRPNGPRSGKWEDGSPRDPIGHGIYAKDLNGDCLDVLTPKLLEELEIKLIIEDET